LFACPLRSLKKSAPTRRQGRKAYAEHEKMGKNAILFVMTDDTKNCDDVAEYLEGNFA
jgi:hypothetical protein